MDNWKKINLPCPKCDSSDAFSIDHNNWGHCFSCGVNIPPSSLDNNKNFSRVSNEKLSIRNISSIVFEKFGVHKVITDKDEMVCFPYPNGSKKYRSLTLPKNNKYHFKTEGPISTSGMFGSNIFPKGGNTIYIVEGEYDALATYEMLKSPAVSPQSSSSIVRDVKTCYDYLNSFKKIILLLDNDDAGNTAASKIAGMFDYNKLYKVNLSRNDPNDFLLENDLRGFLNDVKQAKKFTPDNIINDYVDIEKALEEESSEKIGDYPFSSLNDTLYGMYRGEVVLFKGNTGIGKTEVLRAIEHHLLKTTDISIGIIHAEESKKTTIKAIATYEKRFPFVHLEDTSPKEKIMSAYKEAVGNSERVYIYKLFDVSDEELFMNNIRFLVKVCGCQVIFLDHITWLATGQTDEDDRRKLDRLSQNFKTMAEELDFCLVVVSHTNDDGKTRGSRNISHVAPTIIHLSRENTSSSSVIRNQTHFLVEKGRGGGTKTGPAGFAFYNEETLCLEDPKNLGGVFNDGE